MKTACILSVMLCLPIVARGQQPPFKNPALPVEERVQDLLSRMTPAEKLRQLFMVSGNLADGKEKYSKGICGMQMSARPAGS